MLGDRREPLIKQVLEAIVVRLDDESTPPQVRPPVSNGVDKADELPLISGEGLVAWRDGSTEESDRVALLGEHGAEPV